MEGKQISFIAYHIANLLIFAVGVALTLRAASRLRNTSATYNARLLRFAHFSLWSWIIWDLQYLTLLIGPSTSIPTVFFLNAGLGLGVLHNALWGSAVFSLFSKKSSQDLLTLPLLITVVNVIILLGLQTTALTSGLLTQIDALLAAAIFSAFAVLAVNEWRLNKILAAVFAIHGVSQSIWRSLWLSPLANGHIAILFGFPFSHILFLIASVGLISAMLQRAQPSYQQVVEDIDRPEPPDLTVIRSVMISSTVEDLVEEREAVDRAIQGLGLTRLRAETFGSLPHPPREICAFFAERCDIFILITGKLYGYVLEEGISVVEFEFNVARAANPKKILVYVKDRVNREPELNEFLKRVQDFDHGYFRTLFTTPEGLYERIQQDVTRWLTSPPRLR